MRGHDDIARLQLGENSLREERQHPRCRILQTFAARWGDVVGALPKLHHLAPPTLPSIILVDAGEVAIITLVEGRVGDDRDLVPAKLAENDLEGSPRALQLA